MVSVTKYQDRELLRYSTGGISASHFAPSDWSRLSKALFSYMGVEVLPILEWSHSSDVCPIDVYRKLSQAINQGEKWSTAGFRQVEQPIVPAPSYPNYSDLFRVSSPYTSRVFDIPAGASKAPEKGDNILVIEFANRVTDGKRPLPEAVKIASRLVPAAFRLVAHPEISIDIDGALSFDMRLPNGNLLLAELSMDGLLDGSLYDPQGLLLSRLRKATSDIIINALVLNR